MKQDKFTMKDWQIPFMLFELSSSTQRNMLNESNGQAGSELVTELNNFFNDDQAGEAMDFFWDKLKIGDD